jgi:hypothetical protein
MATEQTATSEETRSSQRKRAPRFGVKPAAEAFCSVCGWYGSVHNGKGAWREASAELAAHKATDAHQNKVAP